jgi:hypothetical protein
MTGIVACEQVTVKGGVERRVYVYIPGDDGGGRVLDVAWERGLSWPLGYHWPLSAARSDA